MCYWCASRNVKIEPSGEARGELVDCPCCGKYRMAHDALFFFFAHPGEPPPVLFSSQQKMGMRVHIFNENILERIPTISAVDIMRITGVRSENSRIHIN